MRMQEVGKGKTTSGIINVTQKGELRVMQHVMFLSEIGVRIAGQRRILNTIIQTTLNPSSL